MFSDFKDAPTEAEKTAATFYVHGAAVEQNRGNTEALDRISKRYRADVVELEHRLTRPEALREKVMAAIDEARRTYAVDDIEDTLFAHCKAAVAAVLDKES